MTKIYNLLLIRLTKISVYNYTHDLVSAGFDPTQSPNSLMNARPYGIVPPATDDPNGERPYTYSPLSAPNPLEQAQSQSGKLISLVKWLQLRS